VLVAVHLYDRGAVAEDAARSLPVSIPAVGVITCTTLRYPSQSRGSTASV